METEMISVSEAKEMLPILEEKYFAELWGIQSAGT